MIKPKILSYDTTFQLGDFYVSSLLFRHSLFSEHPCIPATFLLHERKLTETHIELFKETIKQIPSLKKASIPIVTDRERSILNAIKKEIPMSKMLYCWNHIFRDVRLWCRKHGAPSSDITVYVGDVQQLFHSINEEEYQRNLSVEVKCGIQLLNLTI